MTAAANDGDWLEVEAFVEEFEAARCAGDADPASFLPPPEHPLRLRVLSELVRVDLEYGWEQGSPRDLNHYRGRFPELFHDERRAGEIAFEESRLRRRARPDAPHVETPVLRPRKPIGTDGVAEGPDASGDDLRLAATVYRASQVGGVLAFPAESSVPSAHIELFRELHQADPRAADRLAHAVAELPEPGADFLDFHLLEELGRGSFGRVYLAHQGELANRPVALKVSADVSGESRTLAQLQHTNIVPIYSVHHHGPFQAVCMPYLGSKTLADVLADVRRGATMPDSGRGLFSTRASRSGSGRSSTIGGDATSIEAVPGGVEVQTPMPSQIERLEGLSYTQAVLWLASRLADGLAHAHERGILHRDLKPANILFADDGEPMLLDFNLAHDTKLRVHASAALVGGTLPYMAPEQLVAYRDGDGVVDARSDLYALGVVLFEMLTGRTPFETRRGPVDDVLRQMLADRLGPPPHLRSGNKAITPAVESIVRRCLEPIPERRYQTAGELREDLQRQLDHRPLRYASDPSIRERVGKWSRRHSRLTSSTAVAAFSVVLIAATIGGFLARQRQLLRLEGTVSLTRLDEERRRAVVLLSDPAVPVDLRREGTALIRSALNRYGVLDTRDWSSRPLISALSPEDRAKARESLGTLLILLSRSVVAGLPAESDAVGRASQIREAQRWNDLAAECFGSDHVPGALWLQKAALAKIEGHDAEAKTLVLRSVAAPLRTTLDQVLLVDEEVDQGRFDRAIEVYRAACKADSRDHALWFLLGNTHAALGHHEEAMRCFEVAIALRPDLIAPTFRRGMLALEGKDYRQALEDFDHILAREPRTDALVNRSLAKLALGDAAGAVADLDLAWKNPDAPTRTLLIRSAAHTALGDRERAAKDRAEGLRREPTDDLSYVSRGLARLGADPDGALADFEAALKANPRCLPALQNKAAVLADRPDRVEESVRAFDRLLTLYPGSLAGRTGRGIVLARLGRREAALDDARAALVLDQGAETLYRASNIFAQTSKVAPEDRREAIRLLADGLRKDPSWLRVVPGDTDLDPIREEAEFRSLLDALSVVERLRATAKAR